MHIPDGYLSVPVGAATWATALAGIGPAMRAAGAGLASRAVPLMGVMAAFVFAAQMVNFPIPGATSGHLLGGVLSAAMLGPWAGMLVITVVLIVQALLFADGGVTALGANVVNMALIGSGVGYVVYAPVRRMVGGVRGIVAGAVVAAWVSVLLSALACSAELVASGKGEARLVLNAMMLSHAWIGVGEAAITGLVLTAVVQVRPDLVHRPDPPPTRSGGRPTPEPAVGAAAGWGQIIGAGLAVSLLVAVFLSPLASDFKDGLEKAAEGLGIAEAESPAWPYAPMPDYNKPKDDEPSSAEAGASAEEAEKPAPSQPTQPLAWTATSFAGAVGTLAVFALAFGLARGLAGRRDGHVAADAAA